MPPLKDILGKPGEGIHFHVFGIAIMDVLMTVALALLIGYLAGNWKMSWLWFILLFVLAQVLHLALGVDTTVARLLRRE